MTSAPTPVSHGGILFPLEMFRPSLMGAALGEGLVAKARNVLDAKVVLTRHPEAHLVLCTIEGSVVGDDPGLFWRENADLAMYASQVLPRQCFLYYVIGEPKQQGFIVAQRGQPLAADDATDEQMPPEATEADWPVARLAEQIRVPMSELEGGFAGGPRVEIPMVEPRVDDQELLMTLAGQPPEDEPMADEAQPGAPTTTGPGAGAAQDKPAPSKPPRPTAEQDQKRREAEALAERQARAALAEQVSDGLRFELDEHGAVVVPTAELGDADILSSYRVRRIEGELPEGLPRDLTRELQGRRLDFVVAVEFLSEVMVENVPLSKPVFEEQSEEVTVGGQAMRRLKVLAPRLGGGTLYRRGRAGAFISREVGLPHHEALILQVLDSQG